MCVQLYCIYFNPLAVPVSMSQVMKLPVINIASIVEINFTGSVRDVYLPASEDFTCKNKGWFYKPW